ncbi:MAG TPA: UPF0158 family protein [Thermomicrobiaceae bacterium]|nr:UPF0158 family protein [Thermomicrobiaceae bacterium]
MDWFLDRETGPLVWVDYEMCFELQAICTELGVDAERDAVDLAEIVKSRALPDWQKDMLLDAVQVDRGFGHRFIRVPQTDTRTAYLDTDEFIENVPDEPLREQLARAIEGRGAFRRCRDAPRDAPGERERWHTFQNAQTRARVIEWLRSEGIEPIFSTGPASPDPQ